MKAMNLQNASNEHIKIIDNGVDDLQRLGNVAFNNATESRNLANQTLIEADEHLKEGQRPLEEIDTNKTRGMNTELQKMQS